MRHRVSADRCVDSLTRGAVVFPSPQTARFDAREVLLRLIRPARQSSLAGLPAVAQCEGRRVRLRQGYGGQPSARVTSEGWRRGWDSLIGGPLPQDLKPNSQPQIPQNTLKTTRLERYRNASSKGGGTHQTEGGTPPPVRIDLGR